MKNSLLVFSLLFATVACKNTNSTSNEVAARKMPFDNKAYLRLENVELQSGMRQKFLNVTLAKKLKSDFEIKEFEKITEDEVLKASSLNPLEYYRLKENSAEVVVSFGDHFEIYFVPTGTPRELVMSQLEVVPDQGSEFQWIEAPEAYLKSNKSYYLVSTTKKELKENDIYFHQTEEKVGQDFNEKYFSYSNSQIIKLKIKADYRIKETSNVVLTGRKVTVRKCDWESGGCDQCEYKIETVTGNYIKRETELSVLENLDVIINGKSYSLLDFKPVKDSEGNFIVELDFKKITDADSVLVEFHRNIQYPVYKTVSGFNYSNTCADRNINSTLDVTPSLKVDLEMNVLGRNLSGF